MQWLDLKRQSVSKRRIKDEQWTGLRTLAGWGAAGLFLARIQMPQQMAPAALAVVSAALIARCPAGAVLAGAILGRMTLGLQDGTALQDIAAMLLIYFCWTALQRIRVKVTLPLLLGITLFSTLFVSVGNMIANLLYGVVDPQTRGYRP